MKIIARRNALLLILAIHLGVDVALLSRARMENLPNTFWGIVIAFSLLSWPLSQGCLIAIWAATGRMRFSLRLPLALTGTVPALGILFRLVDLGAFDADAPVFTAILLTQFLAVLFLANAGRFVRRQFRRWRSGGAEAGARPIQFSLRQLLLWTAVLAIILGTGKAVFGWLGWTADILVDEAFLSFQMLAVCNALCGLWLLGLFTVRVRWPVRILLFPLVVAACGAWAWLMGMVVDRFFGQGPNVVVGLLMLAAAQIVYNTMTLWPLWLYGYIGHRSHADVDPKQTTPALDNPFAQ